MSKLFNLFVKAFTNRRDRYNSIERWMKTSKTAERAVEILTKVSEASIMRIRSNYEKR